MIVIVKAVMADEVAALNARKSTRRLVSPETVQKLQTALHAKAKEEPSYRCSMTARGSCNARLGLEDRFGIDRSLPASTTEALDIAAQSAAVQS